MKNKIIITEVSKSGFNAQQKAKIIPNNRVGELIYLLTF